MFHWFKPFMADNLITNERTTTDLTLFGLGFAGFILAVAGVAVASPAAALFGTVLLLLVVLCFGFRSTLRGD
jgi:hypothetical protein